MAFGKPEFTLTPEMQTQIREYDSASPGVETCGFIHQDGSVSQWPNIYYNQTLDNLSFDELVALMVRLQIHDVPQDPELLDEIRIGISVRTGFGISARDRLKAEERGVVAVWHSHCLDSSPGVLTFKDSADEGVHSDITQAKLQRLPYVMHHTRFDEWDLYDPYALSPYPLKKQIANPKNPEEYTGIPYCWNRADCLEVPRAALWGLFEIDLGIHYRSSAAEYLSHGWHRYTEGFPKVGFQEVQMYTSMRFKAGDCLLMQLPGYPSLHHLGVCVDEREQTMLHILDGRISEIEPIGKWLRYVRVVFRHSKFA